MAKKKLSGEVQFFVVAAVLIFAIGLLHGLDEKAAFFNEAGITGLVIAGDSAWIDNSPDSTTVGAEITESMPGSDKYTRSGFEVFLLILAVALFTIITVAIVNHHVHNVDK